MRHSTHSVTLACLLAVWAVDVPVRAFADDSDTVTIDTLECTFGKMKSMHADQLLNARERPAFLAVTNEFDRRYPTLRKVCETNSYSSLPKGAQQVFDRQVLFSDNCTIKLAEAVRVHNFSLALSYAQRMTSIAMSLSNLLDFGDTRLVASESAKMGVEKASDALNLAFGFGGKISKVFEAAEGVLTARALLKDVASDVIIEKLEKPLIGKLSDRVAENVKEQADQYFVAAMARIVTIGSCE